MASLRRVAVSGKFSIEIIKWHVAEGQEVARDAVLASYIYCGGDDSSTFVSERKLKSRFNGRVVNILVGQNQEALPRFSIHHILSYPKPINFHLFWLIILDHHIYSQSSDAPSHSIYVLR